jgi:transketolase C-terminal domain/subunit
MEGGIGPVAGSSHHSIYYRMPGVKIYSPMTPSEYRTTYTDFMEGEDVFYVSEHRGAYHIADEYDDIIFEAPDYVLFPISITRLAAVEASRMLLNEGIRVAVHHIFRIKPFELKSTFIESLSKASCGGCVLDDDYVSGIAKCVAFDLGAAAGTNMSVLGLEERSAGFSKSTDNLPPTPEIIVSHVKNRLTR